MYDRLGNDIGLGDVVMDVRAGFTFVLEQVKLVHPYSLTVDLAVRPLDRAPLDSLTFIPRSFLVSDNGSPVRNWEVIGSIL